MLALIKEGGMVWLFLTFLAILVWTLKADGPGLEAMKTLPLEDDHASNP